MAKDEDMLEVLKEIKTLLEPKAPPPPPPPPKGLWNEFKDFLSKYKVMGLAIAFIMGVYLGAVVQALAKDLLLPAIGLALPGLGNLATFRIPIPSLPAGASIDISGTPIDSTGTPLLPSLWNGQIFGVGDFLVALITFIIVALVIFLIVKITNKWGIE